MNYRITIVANGQTTLQDLLGLEAYAPGAQFTSQSTSFGHTVVFDVPGATMPRLRPYLVELSQRRIPAMDSLGVLLGNGKTMPLLTYDIEPVPGDRPSITQVEGSPLSVGTPLPVTLRGTNLLAGLQAQRILTKYSAQPAYVYPGTQSFPDPVDVLKLVATKKGPSGNNISLVINPESGGGSVVTTFGADGAITITVTPAASASNSTAIANQINGNTVAAYFVTATALVASAAMGPTGVGVYAIGPSASASTPKAVPLTGGDGGGQAMFFLIDSDGSGLGVVTAVKSGNQGNLITLTLNLSQGSNTVAVSGTNITVNRTEAAPTIANIVTAINGNASAALLVSAATITAGNVRAAIAKSWLFGGAGETPVVTIGGAPATITAYDDTHVVLTVLAADLTTAAAAATDLAVINLAMDYRKLSTTILLTT